ncbi:MAG: hypothetical protein H0X66_19945 [Verrucomicrobia bacterium]|nr:hypothetical protein [Verrucomicrobiota bacterium]
MLLHVEGGVNQVCRIEVISALGSTWQEIGAITTGLSGFQTFLDLDATNAPSRFYRVVTP